MSWFSRVSKYSSRNTDYASVYFVIVCVTWKDTNGYRFLSCSLGNTCGIVTWPQRSQVLEDILEHFYGGTRWKIGWGDGLFESRRHSIGVYVPSHPRPSLFLSFLYLPLILATLPPRTTFSFLSPYTHIFHQMYLPYRQSVVYLQVDTGGSILMQNSLTPTVRHRG